MAPLPERLGRVTALVDTEPEAVALVRMRAAETTGRPPGSDVLVIPQARKPAGYLRS